MQPKLIKMDEEIQTLKKTIELSINKEIQTLKKTIGLLKKKIKKLEETPQPIIYRCRCSNLMPN